MNRLDGKTALVTGAARGIGAETARLMAEAGANVVLTDLLEAQGADVALEIGRAGGEAMFLRHDVTDEADWQDVITATLEAYGRLDILVNNAGVYLVKPIEETTLEEVRWLSSVNIEGVFLGTKYAIGAMKAEGGAIVNLSSIAGIVGSTQGSSVYSMSKGGVRLFTKSAALECAHLGYDIRVNSVHPGIIETDMGDAALAKFRQEAGGHNAAADIGADFHPRGRMGQPIDIAKAILFLASGDADFITGTELIVDGGATAR